MSMSAQSSRIFLDSLAIEDGTDCLSGDFGNCNLQTSQKSDNVTNGTVVLLVSTAVSNVPSQYT